MDDILAGSVNWFWLGLSVLAVASGLAISLEAFV